MTLFRSLPAAVALAASALVAPLAVAQPDPAAKSALEASAAAVKANPTMRFMAKAFLEGAAGVRMGGEAQVTILRGAASPGGTSMAFKGTIDALDGVSDVWSSIIEGRTLLYVDTPGKRLVEKPMVSGADVAKNATRPRDYLIAPPLLDGEPFQVDLRAREIVFDGEKDVR
ncbi:MAG: hypothetical protein KIT68_13395, partial [Phycisphaeraceae bacterium]|nr:hypothetical protein [Phycisphaeraceae bacterium]